MGKLIDIYNLGQFIKKKNMDLYSNKAYPIPQSICGIRVEKNDNLITLVNRRDGEMVLMFNFDLDERTVQVIMDSRSHHTPMPNGVLCTLPIDVIYTTGAFSHYFGPRHANTCLLVFMVLFQINTSICIPGRKFAKGNRDIFMRNLSDNDKVKSASVVAGRPICIHRHQKTGVITFIDPFTRRWLDKITMPNELDEWQFKAANGLNLKMVTIRTKDEVLYFTEMDDGIITDFAIASTLKHK